MALLFLTGVEILIAVKHFGQRCRCGVLPIFQPSLPNLVATIFLIQVVVVVTRITHVVYCGDASLPAVPAQVALAPRFSAGCSAHLHGADVEQCVAHSYLQKLMFNFHTRQRVHELGHMLKDKARRRVQILWGRD